MCQELDPGCLCTNFVSMDKNKFVMAGPLGLNGITYVLYLDKVGVLYRRIEVGSFFSIVFE